MGTKGSLRPRPRPTPKPLEANMVTTIRIDLKIKESIEKIRRIKSDEMGTELTFTNIVSMALKKYIDDNKKS